MPPLNELTRLRAHAFFIGAILVSAALMLLKAWPLFVEPRLWAEDATQHFSDAQEQVWYVAIFLPQQGYFSLTANLTALFGTRLLAIEHWPYAPLIVSFVIQLLPVVLMAVSRDETLRTFKQKTLFISAYLALMFSVGYQETWLNVVNSQFYLALSAAIILFQTTPMRFSRYLLAITGLTGVVSAGMAPAFLLKAYFQKSREKLLQALIISAAAGVQLFYVAYSAWVGDVSPYRTASFGADSFLSFYFIRTVIENIAGSALLLRMLPLEMIQHPPIVLLGIYALGIAGFFGVLMAARRIEIHLLFVAYLSVSLLMYFGSLGDKSVFMTPSVGGRYFLLLNGIVMLMLLVANHAAWQVRRPMRILFCGLITLFFIGNLSTSHIRNPLFFEGASWAEQVQQMKEKKAAVLHIWPKGWKMFVCAPEKCNAQTRIELLKGARLLNEKGFTTANTLRLKELYVDALERGVKIRVPNVQQDSKSLLRIQCKVPLEAKAAKMIVEYRMHKKTIRIEKRIASRDVVLVDLPAQAEGLTLTLLAGKGAYRISEITQYK